MTNGREAVRRLFRVERGHISNLPPLLGIFADHTTRPVVRAVEADGALHDVYPKHAFPAAVPLTTSAIRRQDEFAIRIACSMVRQRWDCCWANAPLRREPASIVAANDTPGPHQEFSSWIDEATSNSRSAIAIRRPLGSVT